MAAIGDKRGRLHGRSSRSAASRLVEEILAACRQGRLQAGDRLASVKELCQLHGVGQATVELALAELVDRGLLVRKPRSGCYLTEAVKLIGPPNEPPGPMPPPGPDVSLSDMMSFMVPRPRRSLTVYVTDNSANSMALWHSLVDEFCQARGLGPPHLLSCQDGHIEEILGKQSIDLVETTALMVESLGEEAFLPLPETLLDAAWQGRLIAPVREWLAANPLRFGMPFEMTAGLLFVNRRLAELAGLSSLAGADTATWLWQLRQAQASLAEVKADAFRFSSLFDLLAMSGAVEVSADRALRFAPEIAAGVLEPLQGAGFRPGSTQEHRAFVAGKLLCMWQGSFTTETFATLDLPWQAMPLPLAPGGRMPGWLMQLAVGCDSHEPQASFELIRFLLAPQTQARFAELHANIPVDGDAAASMGNGHLTQADILAAIDQTTLLWPERLRYRLQRDLALERESQALVAGRLSSEALLGQVEFRLKLMANGSGIGGEPKRRPSPASWPKHKMPRPAASLAGRK